MKNNLDLLVNYIYIYGLDKTMRPYYSKTITQLTQYIIEKVRKRPDKLSVINKTLVELLGNYNIINLLKITARKSN